MLQARHVNSVPEDYREGSSRMHREISGYLDMVGLKHR